MKLWRIENPEASTEGVWTDSLDGHAIPTISCSVCNRGRTCPSAFWPCSDQEFIVQQLTTSPTLQKTFISVPDFESWTKELRKAGCSSMPAPGQRVGPLVLFGHNPNGDLIVGLTQYLTLLLRNRSSIKAVLEKYLPGHSKKVMFRDDGLTVTEWTEFQLDTFPFVPNSTRRCDYCWPLYERAWLPTNSPDWLDSPRMFTILHTAGIYCNESMVAIVEQCVQGIDQDYRPYLVQVDSLALEQRSIVNYEIEPL